MTHELTLDEIAKFQQDYQQNKQNKIAELAVVNNGVQKASFNGEGIRDLNRTFSIEIPTDNVTDQKQSGRCWLFYVISLPSNIIQRTLLFHKAIFSSGIELKEQIFSLIIF